MNAKVIAKEYGSLSAEERFRLIMAASGRGDDTERELLMRSSHRIELSFPDHSSLSHAFAEIGNLAYIELLELAAGYFDALMWCEVDQGRGADGSLDNDTADEMAEAESEAAARAERSFSLAMAIGYVLKTKVEGWKLFCERLSVQPFMLWEGLPGFGRLRRALETAERCAYVAKGFRRWLNWVRPAGTPKIVGELLTVELVAKQSEELFQERVRWWRG